jgi:hypothetical protein
MVSLAGHVAAQAAVPSVTVLVPVLGVATLVAWVLSASQWTFMPLVGVMLAVQSVLHLVFSLGSADADGHLTGSMFLGHAAATVVMVVVLHRGEALIWAVVESISLNVPRLLRSIMVPLFVPAPRPQSDSGPKVVRCWHGGIPPRRGPPLEWRSLLISAWR